MKHSQRKRHQQKQNTN